MKTHLSLLLLLGASLGTGLGCYPDCEPEPDITVTLEAASEDVRSLPILASGKTSLLGLDVPDAHGDVRATLRMSNASSVRVTGLRFQEQVDGVPHDIRLVTQEHNGTEVDTGSTVVDQGELRFVWRARNLGDLRLPEARPHTARLTLNWEYQGCRTQTGIATVDVPGWVKAAVSAVNTRLVSAEAARPDVLRGPRVKMALRSAVGDALVDLKDARFTITYFGDGVVPALGLGLVEASQVALQSGGTARTQVEVGETLEVFSSREPAASPATYEAAGSAAMLGTFSGGKALVTLSLTSAKRSTPTVPQVDTLSELIDLP